MFTLTTALHVDAWETYGESTLWYAKLSEARAELSAARGWFETAQQRYAALTTAYGATVDTPDGLARWDKDVAELLSSAPESIARAGLHPDWIDGRPTRLLIQTIETADYGE